MSGRLDVFSNYRIQFNKVFIVCIIIMIFEKVFLIFESANELIVFGDAIYHFFGGLIGITSQLSSSIVAAIIFYYALEFINKQNSMEEYLDFRRHHLYINYFHMEVLSQLSSFDELTIRKGEHEYFYYDDIAVFRDIFYEKFDHNFDLLKTQICDLYKQTAIFDKYVKSCEKELKIINKSKNINSFRGSSAYLRHVNASFNMFQERFQILHKSNEYTDVLLSNFAIEFLEFVSFHLNYYSELELFITAIEDKKIFEFIKRLR